MPLLYKHLYNYVKLFLFYSVCECLLNGGLIQILKGFSKFYNAIIYWNKIQNFK